MRFKFLALAGLAFTTPAMASWELNISEDKKSWSYAAFESDKAGGLELQFFCESDYPGDIQMLLFTDTDADFGEDDHPEVIVEIVIDGTRFTDLVGYYDAVDGERTVVVDTLEEEGIFEVAEAAWSATRPIQVNYDGESQRFGVDGIAETMEEFLSGCDR